MILGEAGNSVLLVGVFILRLEGRNLEPEQGNKQGNIYVPKMLKNRKHVYLLVPPIIAGHKDDLRTFFQFIQLFSTAKPFEASHNAKIRIYGWFMNQYIDKK